LTRRDSGGPVRTYHLAKGLAAEGHAVNVIIPGGDEAFDLDGEIRVTKINGLIPFGLLRFLSVLLGVERAASLYLYDPSFLLRALPIVSKSDLIQIDTPVPGGAFITFILARVFGRLVVIDSHDVFQALRIEYANILRKVIEVPMERVAYKNAKLILTVSNMDKTFLVRCGIPEGKIVVIPNGVDPSVFALSVGAEEHVKNRIKLKNFLTVIFVGNMEYSPNEEAVDFIAEKLAPRVLLEIHNVRFLMVGKKPSKLPSASGLIFTGVVQNVAQYLVASDVAIAPLLRGSGSRLKVLEYLSCGLPVVSTSVGAEGLKVENAVNVFIEDDLDKFHTKVIELLRNENLRTSLGRSGRELVIREYNWYAITKKLSATYIRVSRSHRLDTSSLDSLLSNLGTQELEKSLL
jgi:glycosyltransferase involved in cell wall biosynthesis